MEVTYMGSYSLYKVAMEEGILHVELTYWPVSRRNNAEDGVDRGRLDDWAECLVVVDAGLLREAANNPARLVPGEGAVGVELVFEQPLASDNVHTRWPRYKARSAVVDQRLVLFCHRSAPIGIGEGAAIVCRGG
jgi:hypothetical protein